MDWRHTLITIGARVLYHHSGLPRLGVVEAMRHSDKIGWQLKVRWTEDPTMHATRDPVRSVGSHLGTSAQIRSFSVTVWPEDTCTHTHSLASTSTPSGGTGAPPNTASDNGSPSATTATSP
jgi:hypothetical protein